MSSISEQELKDKGNEAFKQKRYNEAEDFYKQALGLEGAGAKRHILFTNLAAVFFEQKRYEECVAAADQSISLDSTWIKAYYRKAQALEALKTPEKSFSVWVAAMEQCKSSPELKKQFLIAKAKWLQQYKKVQVGSSADLLSRYSLLTDPRERLSTLAHFWNASSEAERLSHFKYFLRMIGGAGEAPDMHVTADMMVEMPLHNYHDLPRKLIEPWCVHFESLAGEEKTRVLKDIWDVLSSGEQTAVIADLKLFLGMQGQQGGTGGHEDEDGSGDLL